MGRILTAGLLAILVAAVTVVALTADSRAQTPSPTPTPIDTATPSPAPSDTPTATPEPSATASPEASATAMPEATRVLPAAVPALGGEPPDGSMNLLLALALGAGVIGGAAAVLAAAYAATRRS